MRTWFSVIAILAAVAYAEPALADSPADVYSDFAENGALSCNHSRSALKGVLNDASLYQYGDPLTFLQLKLAIRRQLARGCNGRTATATGAGDPASSETRADPSGASESKKSARAKNQPRREKRAALSAQDERIAQSGEVQRSGATVILGIGLLLLALGSGGWAAKRAFND